MSGIRRIARPPLYARMSERSFLRWARRETQSNLFAAIGESSVVYPPALIIGHDCVSIEDGVVIHPGAFISVISELEGKRFDPRVSIGRGTRIGTDFVLASCGSIEIGRDVLMADRVYIGDTYHEYRDASKPIIEQGLGDPRPVRIADGCFLGINAAILPGVTLGEGAYIGANAVVTKDVPARALAVGNPARVVRRWDGKAWVEE